MQKGQKMVREELFHAHAALSKFRILQLQSVWRWPQKMLQKSAGNTLSVIWWLKWWCWTKSAAGIVEYWYTCQQTPKSCIVFCIRHAPTLRQPTQQTWYLMRNREGSVVGCVLLCDADRAPLQCLCSLLKVRHMLPTSWQILVYGTGRCSTFLSNSKLLPISKIILHQWEFWKVY